ncbi:CHASE2 domain-containing protein [Chitinimonas sp.]|uniref:CHASE2 domain-containing protein n=1 Tax=Chitinimonas sp. TaxID=1934313 RepID=UPI0035AE685B
MPTLSRILNTPWVAAIINRAGRSTLPWPGLLAALFTLALSLSSAWWLVELKLFDRMLVATAPNKVALPITIIGIDEASFAKLKRQWPWPREWHAQLVNNLHDAGAAIVAFDVVFSEASQPESDAAFAQAIREAGNVVLAADRDYRETEGGGGTRQWMRVDPWEGFVQAGAKPGFASVELDPDTSMRQVPFYADALWRSILTTFDKRNPGIVTDLTASQGMYIRYQGGPHTFKYIPYYQMLDPDRYLGSEWKSFLHNNIVLVGRDLKATTEVNSAQSDLFQTPFFGISSQQLMPGVEVHANLIANMVEGNAIRKAPLWWRMLMFLLTAGLALISMRHWQPLRSGLYGLGLLGALLGLAFWLMSHRLIWLPVSGAMCAVVLIYLAQGGVAYLVASRQRREIKQAFAKYLSPTVVDEVVAHPERLRLGGERRELTLLFTDLAGFTSISEAMQAEQVAQILNRHLTEMTEIVLRHNGTLDKFIGDAVMAFWGAPVLSPDQSEQAVRSAIEMQQKVAAMRLDLEQTGGPALHMRVGIHRGECIVGNMGGEDHFDYTAIGDAVNLASRLEGVNKFYGTQILCSESVAHALAGKIALRRVDVVRVKGKQAGVAIFTPCDDAELMRLSDIALRAFEHGPSLQQEAEQAWQLVLDHAPQDALAQHFLARLAQYRAEGWPEGWDGITTLESK